MTTLQDVCSQLMKPAKDLAEWNFPLAQILEDYYTLLSQPCDLNFGEAALVLQNSANVYVRRVEYLYQETAALSKSMQEHEDEAEEHKAAKSSRKSRKSIIDFKNFDLIDFSNEVLKKINESGKSRKENREIKLISPRFPQLENISRHKFSQDIIDVNGEIIGKKYDFRCNQQLTVSRMLIEEVTPLNFNDLNTLNDSNNEELNDSTNIAQITEVLDDNNSELCSDDDDNCRDVGILSPTQESGYESMVLSSVPNTPSSRVLSDFSQTLHSCLIDHDYGLPSPIVDSCIESDGSPNDSGIEQSRTPDAEHHESDSTELGERSCYTSSDKDSTPDKVSTLEQDTSTDKDSNIKNDSNLGKDSSPEKDSNVKTDSNPKINSNPTQDCSVQMVNPSKESNDVETESVVNNMEADKNLNIRDSIETDAGYTSGDPDDLPTSSMPKKLRRSNDEPEINETIENTWRPIPVESVVPDKIPRSRREFKLPCNIALLKSVPQLRKRCIDDSSRKQSSKRATQNKEAKEAAKKAEEIKKLFEERLQIQSKLGRNNYNPVLNDYSDLLGFQSESSRSRTLNKQDTENNINSIENRSRNNSLSEELSLPPSPRSCISDSGEVEELADISEVLGFKTVGQSHLERIERKMQALKKEFDVKHHMEEETNKWYEAVEALKAAESRPSFHVDEYEKKIIDSLKAKNEHQVEFHEIVGQEEPGNVARLFVASLHLANTYNVEINVVNKEDNSELNLKLLDAEFTTST